MIQFRSFEEFHKIDYEGLVKCILRKGTPNRVFNLELFQDWEIEEALINRHDVLKGLDKAQPGFYTKRRIAVQRYLGYDYVPVSLLSINLGTWPVAADTVTGDQAKKGNRQWVDEHKGIIASWEDFEKYQWPDGKTWNLGELEWFERNLPDDMCIIGRGGSLCEYLCWLMGYETLCYALYEQRDLVRAIADKILSLEEAAAKVLLQSHRVKGFWASDDMGFKTGPMFSPDDMREFVFSGHRRLASLAHAAGKFYILHACGNREQLIEDLISDVKLDGIHSWEDTIESIIDAKRSYGNRISLLGGIDIDFLCRRSEEDIRNRVRETVKACQPGGGFCLGTGNTVANYIPLDNYLAMLDEGRKL